MIYHINFVVLLKLQKEDFLKKLLKYVPFKHIYSGIISQCRLGNLENVRLLIKTGYYDKECLDGMVFVAFVHRRFNIIDYLHKNFTPRLDIYALYDACEKGHIDVVNYIIKRFNCISNYTLRTCLSLSIENNNDDISKLLISHNPEISKYLSDSDSSSDSDSDLELDNDSESNTEYCGYDDLCVTEIY